MFRISSSGAPMPVSPLAYTCGASMELAGCLFISFIYLLILFFASGMMLKLNETQIGESIEVGYCGWSQCLDAK